MEANEMHGGKPLPEDDPLSRMNRHERRRAKAQRRHDAGKARARRNERKD